MKPLLFPGIFLLVPSLSKVVFTMSTQIQQQDPRRDSASSVPDKDAEAVAHVEAHENLTAEDSAFLQNFTEEQRKKLMWKVWPRRADAVLCIDVNPMSDRYQTRPDARLLVYDGIH